MQKYEGAAFQGEAAWRGPNIARLKDADVKLRWTDRPFEWHANSGDEVFVVLDGVVDMRVRSTATAERVVTLHAGDILFLQECEEHVAEPRGPARIRVIEEREPPVT
jgi:mannose-6-phosphate isomerase-like protein (cupin superfamily)